MENYVYENTPKVNEKMKMWGKKVGKICLIMK